MQEIYKILSRIKERFDITTDVELADLMGVKQNTISSWRSRGNIPYKKIIAFCDKHEIDKDLILGSKVEKINANELSSEMSDIVKILSTLKEEDITKFNLLKSLIGDYKKILDYTTLSVKEQPAVYLVEAKPQLAVASPEPKCFTCKEKLINFEFDGQDDDRETVLICKNCNVNDEEQIRLYGDQLAEKTGNGKTSNYQI